MEKAEIIKRVYEVKTVSDFADLLDEIKQDEFGIKHHKITEKQLLHFCNPKIVPNRYKTFHIKKKNGKLREINAPCYQLSVLLYMTNIVFKSLYYPSDAAMGFTQGRSIVDNAQMHVGHHYVLNIDLKDFFTSIPQARVWKRLQLPPFNFPVKVASVVAGLCCTPNEEGTQNVLPQGASTSPLLTNAICDNLDRKLKGVAKRFGLHYSRYADDMTFSSMHNVYQKDGEFMKEIMQIIEEQGFKMNDDKTRLLRNGERQEVTGLTVNQHVNVCRKYIRDLRCILHVWEKEGYIKAYSYFYPHYKKEKGYIKKGEPIMENVIEGKLNYLKMVKGSHDTAYKKLLERFNRLQQVVYIDSDTDEKKNYIYVQSYTMSDFLKDFETELTLEVSSKNNLIGRCFLAGTDKSISISKSTQKILCPNIGDLAPGDKVQTQILKDCFVTLCRAKGKNFWLITKSEPIRSKCLSLVNVNIDIDKLLMIWEHKDAEYAASLFHEAIMNGTPIPTLDELGIAPKKKKKKSIAKAIVNSIEDVPLDDFLGDDFEFISPDEIDITI